MNEQAPKEKGKKEGRSPGYPAINLKAALDRVRVVMDKEKRHYAALTTLFSHWGYGPKSSQGMLLLAALKKYGLMESKGTGASREARITDLAWRILVDDRPHSDERATLIREAALNPTVHRKLWSEYEGQLPSDENLRHRLITDERFTRGAVDDFIRQFQATISFAKLGESDSLLGHEEDKPPVEEDQIMPSTRDINVPDRTPLPPAPSEASSKTGELKFEVGLSDGQITYFRAAPSMTPEDWEKVRSLLDVLAPARKSDVKQQS